ncbi:MAG TPA: ankyrin repeat domain-containing protein [Fimbriimonadaceae bacterium]|jgi:ankyrin repeat protein
MISNLAKTRRRRLASYVTLAAMASTVLALSTFVAAGCYKEFTLNDPLMQAAEDGNLAQVQALIRAGADPNFVSDPADTPLASAAYDDHPDVVKALFKAGANPNWLVDGETALDYAHSAETKRILLKYGGRHASILFPKPTAK